MTYETIRGRLVARPFQPFRVVTSSGQAYEMRHPEMAFPTRTEMVIASPDRNGIPSRARSVRELPCRRSNLPASDRKSGRGCTERCGANHNQRSAARYRARLSRASAGPSVACHRRRHPGPCPAACRGNGRLCSQRRGQRGGRRPGGDRVLDPAERGRTGR